MKFSVKQLAEFLGGVIENAENVKGAQSTEVYMLSKIEEAKEGSVAFLANSKYTSYIYSTEASAVIVNEDFIPTEKINTILIRVKDAYASFTRLLELVDEYKKRMLVGIEPNSFIHSEVKYGESFYLGAFSYVSEGSQIGDNVKIYPQVFIGENCTIANDTVIYSGVKIYDGCQIGKNCTIHANTVIGSDGFGFAPQADGSFKKIPQTGIVKIEDDVEIGACCAIDRATMGCTLIKQGAKLDNLVQIAHNVEIGKNSVIASQVGIAGSTKIGDSAMFGGQVGIAGHLKIGSGVKLGAQSGVMQDIKDGEILQGSPAINLKAFYKIHIILKNLDELRRDVLKLKKNYKNEQ